MALEGHARVGGRHAAAIVDNLNERPAGIFYYYGNGRSASIDGIFDKFLYHRGRTLDNLAGGNLIGYGIG